MTRMRASGRTSLRARSGVMGDEGGTGDVDGGLVRFVICDTTEGDGEGDYGGGRERGRGRASVIRAKVTRRKRRD